MDVLPASIACPGGRILRDLSQQGHLRKRVFDADGQLLAVHVLRTTHAAPPLALPWEAKPAASFARLGGAPWFFSLGAKAMSYYERLPDAPGRMEEDPLCRMGGADGPAPGIGPPALEADLASRDDMRGTGVSDAPYMAPLRRWRHTQQPNAYAWVVVPPSSACDAFMAGQPDFSDAEGLADGAVDAVWRAEPRPWAVIPPVRIQPPRACSSPMMLEKSSPPLPARLCAAYRDSASPPSGTGLRLAMAASSARPRSFSIRSVPKPPL